MFWCCSEALQIYIIALIYLIYKVCAFPKLNTGQITISCRFQLNTELNYRQNIEVQDNTIYLEILSPWELMN